MSYLVIELFGGPEYAAIVTNEKGDNLVFEMLEDAEQEADECQLGLVVNVK
jgi:hypothetical protein